MSSGNMFSLGHSRQIYLGFRPLTAGKIYTIAFSPYLPAALSDSKIIIINICKILLYI